MWVLDHLVDLESDFSAIHRVDDIYTMDGPRFFQFAMRLPAYKSVMRSRVEETQERQNKKYKGREVEHKSLDEVQKVKGGSELFDRVRV